MKSAFFTFPVQVRETWPGRQLSAPPLPPLHSPSPSQCTGTACFPVPWPSDHHSPARVQPDRHSVPHPSHFRPLPCVFEEQCRGVWRGCVPERLSSGRWGSAPLIFIPNIHAAFQSSPSVTGLQLILFSLGVPSCVLIPLHCSPGPIQIRLPLHLKFL